MFVDSDNQETQFYAINKKLMPYYFRTYFSVVSEVNFYETASIQHTEKTFNPITQKHPFILVSAPYSLAVLKDIGYKTFAPFIDESYDTELNNDKRLLKIASEIERLCNLTDSQLQVFLAGVKDICQYNFNNLVKDYEKVGKFSRDLT